MTKMREIFRHYSAQNVIT